MRVLLTGASGFAGSQALTSLILSGAEVHAVSRRRPDANGDFVWHQVDLLVPGAASAVMDEVRPDCVLHLAWCVEHGKFWTDPKNADWGAATLALAHAALSTGAKRFVCVGTCYEYDWPDEAPCDEVTTPLRSHTLYDETKINAHLALKGLFDKSDVALAWARLFFLYGPNENPGRLVSSVARALVQGEEALCSAGLAVRDFMDVRDAGAALSALSLSAVSGSVNIASGEGVTVADLVQTLGRLAGRPDLVRLGALPDRTGEPPHIVAVTRRLHDEVGFRPVRDLDTGLRDALAFWADKAER
ncbi:MAG TPA: NAD(P)-dependent oxidoreductase [Parvibaculum sp.]|jgi:nucleoside-diphosphate-sugar epimerase